MQSAFKSNSGNVNGAAAPGLQPRLQLKALVEADPGSLVRVLQFFQARNVVPLRVASERVGAEYLQIELELDPAELSADGFRVVVGKINELPIVIAAVACE